MQHEVVLVFGLLVANGTLKLGLDAALEAQVPVEAVRPGVRVAAPGARVRAALLHQRRRGRRRRIRGAPRSRRQRRRRRRRTRSSVRRRRPHGQNLGIQVDSAAACKKQGAPHTLVRPTVSNSTIAFMIVSLRGCDLRWTRGCAGGKGGWYLPKRGHHTFTGRSGVGLIFLFVCEKRTEGLSMWGLCDSAGGCNERVEFFELFRRVNNSGY